jgi:1-aminocyclopropane-1-carboxylate deaminase/D-cysteine desulfhydrase-like pyridoxal-dependent ACC family enzyme
MEICSAELARDYDVICCACGTGATTAGIILSTSGDKRYIGFPAMKGGEFLLEEIRRHLEGILSDKDLALEMTANLSLDTRWHFGGYGKWDDELLAFMREFERSEGIPLDQIYTGKMLFGLARQISNGELADEDRVLVIHSGGLQGRISAGL